MTRITVVVGSTRPSATKAVANRVHDYATKRTDAQFNLVDLAEQDLPLLDRPVALSAGQYSKKHIKA